MRDVLKGLAAALAFALLLSPARAADTAEVVGTIQAHPALWTVHGPKGTAYLFGSIHILPPNMQWHTPQVTKAMAASDTFVFEIPMDAQTQASVQDFVRDNAFLPESQALPQLLSDDARKDYTDALALTQVPPDQLVNKRPWFAMLILDIGYMKQRHLSPDAGVDRKIYAEVSATGGKSFGAFETPEQQFRLLMPEDRKLEISEFDESLKELLHDQGTVGNMIDAWAHGDEKALNKILNSDLGKDPKVEKALFEDRNRNWVGQIEKMLTEKHTYFITVGAGHLAGPKGVPALLRAKGYKVEGP